MFVLLAMRLGNESESAGAGRRVAGRGALGSCVHVWSTSLDRSDEAVLELARLLTGDERERAARFHFDRDRSRYIVGRGSLRVLLGSYLGLEPDQVQLAYGHNGKPQLRGAGPSFNLS